MIKYNSMEKETPNKDLKPLVNHQNYKDEVLKTEKEVDNQIKTFIDFNLNSLKNHQFGRKIREEGQLKGN